MRISHLCAFFIFLFTNVKGGDKEANPADWEFSSSLDFLDSGEATTAFPYFCEIHAPPIDRKLSVVAGRVVDLFVQAGIDEDAWTGEHTPFSICIWSDLHPENCFIQESFLKVVKDTIFQKSYSFFAWPLGEQRVSCSVVTPDGIRHDDEGRDSFVMDVLPESETKHFAHLISSEEWIDVSMHCRKDTIVILQLPDSVSINDHVNDNACWHTVFAQEFGSLSKRWNQLKVESDTRTPVKFYIFFDGQASLHHGTEPVCTGAEIPDQKVDSDGKSPLEKLHDYLLEWNPAIASVRSHDLSPAESPVIAPLSFDIGILAIHVDAAPGMFPLTYYDFLDTRLSIVPLWIYGAVLFKNETVSFQDLCVRQTPSRFQEMTAGEGQGSQNRLFWTGGSLFSRDKSPPWFHAVQYLASAISDSSIMLYPWTNMTAVIPGGHPTRSSVDVTYRSKFFSRAIDFCHPVLFHNLGEPFGCDYEFWPPYQHSKREAALVRRLDDGHREIMDRLDKLSNRVESMTLLTSQLRSLFIRSGLALS